MSGVRPAATFGPRINVAIPSGGGSFPGTYALNLNSNATYSMDGGGGGNWIEPPLTAYADDYEVKVDPTAGTFSSGTTGTWLAMTSNRTWNKSVVGTVTFTISWRLAASAVQVAQQTGVQIVVT